MNNSRQLPKKNKSSLNHSYAAIEHRVIDSPAFADLSHSSIRLLLIMVRQLTGTNNGQLQATWSYCKPRGLGSENTLRVAIAELISHGFIYRTRSRGPNKQWAKYAVTWVSIKKREGLFLDGFLFDAWKHWKNHPLKNAVSDHQKA
jgi:hypothetical protein